MRSVSPNGLSLTARMDASRIVLCHVAASVTTAPRRASSRPEGAETAGLVRQLVGNAAQHEPPGVVQAAAVDHDRFARVLRLHESQTLLKPGGRTPGLPWGLDDP